MTFIKSPSPVVAATRAETSFEKYAARRLQLSGGRFIENGDHPWFSATDKLAAEAEAAGHQFVSFAHYDYLGLGLTDVVHKAAHAALEEDGIGVGASRLVGGERLAHGALEQEMADFIGVGGTLLTISAYLANASVIPHITGRRDLILTDQFAHNSVAMGARYSKAQHISFPHNDLDALEALIMEHRASHQNVLVCVDALYSMDGDVVDVHRLIELKHKYDVWLLLDEAHSMGTLGPRGAGLTDMAGVDPTEFDIITGSFSKAFAASGGFIAAPKEVITWLQFTLPSFVYSVGLATSPVRAAHEALKLLKKEPQRLRQLEANASHFANTARAAGFDVLGIDGGPVQAVLFNSMEETLGSSAYLEAHGVYAPPIAHVGVPTDAPRIRFFMTSEHTAEQINYTVDLLAEYRASLTPALRASTL